MYMAIFGHIYGRLWPYIYGSKKIMTLPQYIIESGGHKATLQIKEGPQANPIKSIEKTISAMATARQTP